MNTAPIPLEEMPLEPARALAQKITSALLKERICTHAEIAGSIRRGRPIVQDIDLVLMGCDPAKLRQRLAKNCVLETQGEKNILARLSNGFQLDIFIAHEASRTLLDVIPSNWGSLLLCRTGSKEFNVQFATKARAQGLYWDPYQGVLIPQRWIKKEYRAADGTMKTRDVAIGEVIGSETEEDCFEAIGMPFVEPERRES